MAALVTDVLDYLEAQGLVGGASGWARSAEYLPPDPDQVVAVFTTPGREPELAKAGSAEIEYDEPGFQVRVRAGEFGTEAARAQAQVIYLALHGSALSPATGDPAYVLVRALQSAPFWLGLDAESRPGYTWNFLAFRERG